MKRRQTIFRVQNKAGDGPYTANNRPDAVERMREKHNETHPTPTEDGIIEEMDDQCIYCGFKSMKQLEFWFSAEELIMLSLNGFGIVKVPKAHIVGKGSIQLLYISDEDWQYREN
jgi:hypothetical protein